MKRSQALVRRRRRSLQTVTAAAGAFGALVTVLMGVLLIWLTGGGTVAAGLVFVFAIAAGAGGGWLLGRLAARGVESDS